ncbi:endonuclease V [Streptomyces sp. NPDC048172]|uniref:endonuclease V n=1 Tax=Streptomyces sp. NPDC048172 TaxID=3365505 RepID=UPI0037116B3A
MHDEADGAAEAEARAEQERLRALVRTESAPWLRLDGAVAGADVAYDDEAGVCAAAVVVLDGRTLDVLDRAVAVRPVEFPYVPGLLAFREAPPLLHALDGLGARPDVLVCDGYGVAHPRRVGLASHVGVLTGIPSLGVAKNPLTFAHEEPGEERGSWAPLTDGESGGEVVGRALRTRDGVKPLFVSAGHLVGLDDACALTLRLTPRYRQPETTRLADRLCRDALKSGIPR